jgi:hypothetical protein
MVTVFSLFFGRDDASFSPLFQYYTRPRGRRRPNRHRAIAYDTQGRSPSIVAGTPGASPGSNPTTLAPDTLEDPPKHHNLRPPPDHARCLVLRPLPTVATRFPYVRKLIMAGGARGGAESGERCAARRAFRAGGRRRAASAAVDIDGPSALRAQEEALSYSSALHDAE